jgi:MerR family transcriptional regulator, thiopeptide resistance regulator
VLVYRTAGLPLDEIAVLLDDPDVDTLTRLRRQHELLLARAARLHDTITALEKLTDAHRSGIQLTAEEQVEIFGTTAFSGEYAAEAKQRWGHTGAWTQSRQRAAELTKLTTSSRDWPASCTTSSWPGPAT